MTQGEVTQLLVNLRNVEASEKLFPLVYSELRRLANSYMRRERTDHTLQTTALVNEAFIKMAGNVAAAFNNRSHFFAIAAQAMRQVLVDHARGRRANKRGGDAKKMPLDEALAFSDDQSDQLLALDDALHQLEQLSPRQAKVVELRFFVGLSVPETAEALDVSPKTVVREWTVAQAWLRRELSR